MTWGEGGSCGRDTLAKKNPVTVTWRGFYHKALAVTYFHMGRPHTIIGDTPFHF